MTVEPPSRQETRAVPVEIVTRLIDFGNMLAEVADAVGDTTTSDMWDEARYAAAEYMRGHVREDGSREF